MPPKPTHRTNRFKVNGVWYEVDWEKFTPGTSIFVPTLKVSQVRQKLYAAGMLTTGDLETRVTVENGVYGVRVWRVK